MTQAFINRKPNFALHVDLNRQLTSNFAQDAEILFECHLPFYLKDFEINNIYLKLYNSNNKFIFLSEILNYNIIF